MSWHVNPDMSPKMQPQSSRRQPYRRLEVEKIPHFIIEPAAAKCERVGLGCSAWSVGSSCGLSRVLEIAGEITSDIWADRGGST